MSKDEEYVRSVWKSVELFGADDTWSTLPFGVKGLSGPCATEELAWSAAAEFTRTRLEQVRQLRDAIELIEDYRAGCIAETDDHNTLSFILARLESELAKLTQGMRPEALQ